MSGRGTSASVVTSGSPAGRAVFPRTAGQAGFSLIEVIAALGLLAGILISIAGLFVIGDRQVKSGRNSSEALAVARAILEEMDGWSFDQLYALYGSDGTTANYTVRSTDAAQPEAPKWQAELDTNLYNPAPGLGPFAEIRFDALDDAATLGSAPAIRVEVTVYWTEGLRGRQVRLVTVRV
jgi:type II secretory pathway pseudopilin PulG